MEIRAEISATDMKLGLAQVRPIFFESDDPLRAIFGLFLNSFG